MPHLFRRIKDFNEVSESTYILVLRGVGEGCDYTIGCNYAVYSMKAMHEEDALLEAQFILSGFVHEDGEVEPSYFGNRIESALLINTKDAKLLPIEQWNASFSAKCDNLEKESKEEEEKELYEKLKKKFG